MPLQHWLNVFLQDGKVQAVFLLLIADWIFGVGAAIKGGYFRGAYIADLLKNDVLGKVLPYFGFYVFAIVQGSEDIVIPGLDFGLIAGAAYVLVVGALTFSVLNSIRELGFSQPEGQPANKTASILADENPS